MNLKSCLVYYTVIDLEWRQHMICWTLRHKCCQRSKDEVTCVCISHKSYVARIEVNNCFVIPFTTKASISSSNQLFMLHSSAAISFLLRTLTIININIIITNELWHGGLTDLDGQTGQHQLCRTNWIKKLRLSWEIFYQWMKMNFTNLSCSLHCFTNSVWRHSCTYGNSLAHKFL